MGSINLPSQDSADVYLATATPEEAEALQHANSSEWKGALNVEAYLRREKYLGAQDLTKDGGLTSWVLVWQPGPAAERQVLSGCETIKKRALVSRDGNVEEVICHGLCSVFCPPAFRGRGYASRMMTEVGKKLENWQVDNGKAHLFSVLYSDIGKQFYAAKGWHPFPSSHITLPAKETPSAEGVRLLHSQDLAALCVADEDLIRARLKNRKAGSQTAVSIIPDLRTLAWTHAREDFVCNELYHKTPSIRGARVNDVWAYWARVWSDPTGHEPNTLHILRLVVEDDALGADFSPASAPGTEAINAAAEGRTPIHGVEASRVDEIRQSIAKIFQVAQTEAARWDMKEVVLWNPTSLALAGARQISPNVVVQEREVESIASLKWYGEGSGTEVEWVENMKYAWC